MSNPPQTRAENAPPGSIKPSAGPFLQRVAATPSPAARLQSAAALGRRGRHAEAAKVLREAVKLDPQFVDGWLNLGVALEKSGKLAEAVEAYRKTIELAPSCMKAFKFMGNALRQAGLWGQAAQAERQAIRLAPNDPTLYGNLATTLSHIGCLEEVIACRRKAVELQPTSVTAGSALLTALHYDSASTPAQLLSEAREWAKRCCRGAKRWGEGEMGGRGEGELGRRGDTETRGRGEGHTEHPSFSASPRLPISASPRLRIGYVSGNLVGHPEGRFLRIVLANIDRDRFETFVYSSTPTPDALTVVLKGLADHWQDIGRLDDDTAGALIRKHRVDILVDLTGHFGHGRLPLFARRLAPIQVAHFGYPGTTGLDSIDWRITDEVSDPQRGPDDLPDTTESLWRLAGYLSCYEPPPEARSIERRSKRDGKPITFICPNNPLKVTLGAIAAWARILRDVPDSRLEMLAEGGDGFDAAKGRRHYFQEEFLGQGIDPARVRLVSRHSRGRGQYFEWIHSADIALDPFPYNGCQTTCDTLWMGVPVVTLQGDSNWSRQGLALLRQVGLADLTAVDVDDYVNIAVRLASDAPRLAEIRASLRDRMRSSELCDCIGYVGRLESAYEEMWRGRTILPSKSTPPSPTDRPAYLLHDAVK